MADYRVISADAHVVEPPSLWTDRMDPSFGEWIPQMVNGEFHDFWRYGNQQDGILAAIGANTGLRFDKAKVQEMSREGRFADVLPGGYDPHAHIKDIESDGVYGSLVYPTKGRHFLGSISDQGVVRAIVTAYNDWIAEFCQPFPNRLKGIPMILLDDDVQAGILELRRCATMGLPGALIATMPSPGQEYHDPRYEPFWEAAQELDMPISLHAGTSRPTPPASAKSHAPIASMGEINDRDTGKAAQRINMDHWIRLTLCHIVLSGVFERYPDLKVVSVENDVGWVPFFAYRCDNTYMESTFASYRFKAGAVPSNFLRNNVYYTFMDDPLTMSMREQIGVEQLMWGSDYPHAESTFPRSQAILDEMFQGVPENEKAKIVGGNCSRLYKFH